MVQASTRRSPASAIQRLRRDWIYRYSACVGSFVTGRSQQVLYKGCLSAVQPVQYGRVPQGRVLGPILFVLYTAEISRVVAQHGLKFHQYADDCQIYVATSVSEVHSAIDQLSRCLHDVDVWMSASRLRLNASKCCSQCHLPAFALSSRRRRLDECEPTMPECQQDTSAVARLRA